MSCNLCTCRACVHRVSDKYIGLRHVAVPELCVRRVPGSGIVVLRGTPGARSTSRGNRHLLSWLLVLVRFEGRRAGRAAINSLPVAATRLALTVSGARHLPTRDRWLNFGVVCP